MTDLRSASSYIPVQLVALLLLLLASCVSSQCREQTSAQACLQANQQATTTTFCVWEYARSTCIQDPCTAFSRNASACRTSTSGCVLQPLSRSQILCYSAQLSCSMLTQGQCAAMPMCQTIGTACAFPRSFNGSDVSLDQKCASFPMWSIALLIVWLVIMVIIGVIVMLIFKQKRDDAIMVEQSETHIDSVQVNRTDNFRPARNELERPLM
jgi:hypothetical protein